MRTNFLRSIATGALLVGSATALEAQSCLGRPSFALGSVQFGGIATFGDDQTTIGPELGLGAAQGLFAIGSVSYLTVSDDTFDDDPSGWVLDLNGGFEFRAGVTQRLSVCPVIGFAYGTAGVDEGGFDIDVKTRQLAGGLFAGYDIRPAGETGMTWIPFGGVRVANANFSIEEDGTELADDDETYFPTTLGIGLAFSNGWGINGNVVIPFGLDEADPRFGVGLTFAFGRRR